MIFLNTINEVLFNIIAVFTKLLFVWYEATLLFTRWAFFSFIKHKFLFGKIKLIFRIHKAIEALLIFAVIDPTKHIFWGTKQAYLGSSLQKLSFNMRQSSLLFHTFTKWPSLHMYRILSFQMCSFRHSKCYITMNPSDKLYKNDEISFL